MVTEIGSLVHSQRQQLEVGFNNMISAKDKTRAAKENVIEAVRY